MVVSIPHAGTQTPRSWHSSTATGPNSRTWTRPASRDHNDIRPVLISDSAISPQQHSAQVAHRRSPKVDTKVDKEPDNENQTCDRSSVWRATPGCLRPATVGQVSATSSARVQGWARTLPGGDSAGSAGTGQRCCGSQVLPAVPADPVDADPVSASSGRAGRGGRALARQ